MIKILTMSTNTYLLLGKKYLKNLRYWYLTFLVTSSGNMITSTNSVGAVFKRFPKRHRRNYHDHFSTHCQQGLFLQNHRDEPDI